MSPLLIGLATFVSSCGSAFAGMALRARLPADHLDGDSKDVVKLVMGLIATMAALVLGLLVAAAQSSYNTQNGNLQQLAADIAQLDHALAIYGPETKNTRELLQQAVATLHDHVWSSNGVQAEKLNPLDVRSQADRFFVALQSLTPQTSVQRFAHSEALQLSASIGQTRSLMFEQARSAISWPFLLIVVFWVCVPFLGFGLFARFHATVALALLIGSLSISAALFLILELGNPYSGLIQLSDAPLRGVLAQMGQVTQ